MSWDLIPRAAIERVELIGGGDPLFGFNSLGGALSLHTKDGFSAPGTELHVAYGSDARRQIEAQTGGHADSGYYWYATANQFRDDGWRYASPSDAKQGFVKLGWRNERTDVSLTASRADTDLTGNGLQDYVLLERDYESVYTRPDNTQNNAGLLNFKARQQLDGGLTLSGNACIARSARRPSTATSTKTRSVKACTSRAWRSATRSRPPVSRAFPSAARRRTTRRFHAGGVSRTRC